MVVPTDEVRPRDRALRSARKKEDARVRRMSVRERMILALELGRRGRAFEKRARDGRDP